MLANASALHRVAENSQQIVSFSDKKASLRPHNWRLIRILLRTKQISESKVSCSSPMSQKVMRFYFRCHFAVVKKLHLKKKEKEKEKGSLALKQKVRKFMRRKTKQLAFLTFHL